MSDDSREDRGRASNNYVRNYRDSEPYFWKPLYKFGKLWTIQFDVGRDTITADEENIEATEDGYDGRRGNLNVTGSGDRDRENFEMSNDQLGFEDGHRKGRSLKHQRCHRHYRSARRRRRSNASESSAQLYQDDHNDISKKDSPFQNWDKQPEVLPGYLQQGVDDNGTDGSSWDEDGEEIEIDQEEPHQHQETVDERKTVKAETGDANVCKCPPGTFTLENLKLKWKQIRGLMGRCYPALPCNDGDYYILPQCPPVEDHCESEGDDDPSRTTRSNDESSGSDQMDDTPPVTGQRGIEGAERQTIDKEVDESGQFSKTDDRAHETIVCYTPEFWAKFFQIVILAPLLAFTAYLFVEWLIFRRRYNKKSTQLKKLKRQNEVLRSECDRLEAYFMSAQMSPLANRKRQAKAKDEAARICQSLNDCKQKMRELEEERSVLLEVLHNLRKPDEDRGDQCPTLPIFTNPEHHALHSTVHDPMCSCTCCISPT